MAKTEQPKIQRKKLTPEQYKSLEMVTKRVIISYPHVFEKGEYQGKETNYNVTMCIKKQSDDMKTDEGLKPFREKLSLAKKLFMGPDPKKWPKGCTSPIKDGDENNMEGFWLIKATSNNKIPVRTHDNKEIITEPSDIYGGVICRCHIQASYFNLGKDRHGDINHGVKFYIMGMQKMADGERLGGGANSKAAFEMEADEENEDAENPDNYEDGEEEEENFNV